MQIKKGDEIHFLCRGHFAAPHAAIVIAVTAEPGKHIGVQFDQEVPGGHSCDGRGPNKQCLWIHPNDVVTKDEAQQVHAALALKAAAAQDDFVLTIDRGSKKFKIDMIDAGPESDQGTAQEAAKQSVEGSS